MITFTQGNIFEANCEAIVNTVNTKGIMGKGLALQFKKNFPQNFIAYEKACKNNEVKLGEVFIYRENTLTNSTTIINFPTKDHWKSKSKISDIEIGLYNMIEKLKELKIKSVAIPPLGCGLGGLNWKDVKELIIKCCKNENDINFIIFEPLIGKNPAPKFVTNEKLTELRAVILYCFKRYLAISDSPTITLLELHKICYFLQELNIPLKLRFKPYIYGPYATNLSHVLEKLEGTYLSGFRDGTVKAFEGISLLDENLKDIEEKISPNYIMTVNEAINFLFGFATPVGLELLATIHWLIKHENIPSNFETIKINIQNWGKAENQDWGKRKMKYFTDDAIKLAINHISNNL